jgi:hypothetical protein
MTKAGAVGNPLLKNALGWSGIRGRRRLQNKGNVQVIFKNRNSGSYAYLTLFLECNTVFDLFVEL